MLGQENSTYAGCRDFSHSRCGNAGSMAARAKRHWRMDWNATVKMKRVGNETHVRTVGALDDGRYGNRG